MNVWTPNILSATSKFGYTMELFRLLTIFVILLLLCDEVFSKSKGSRGGSSSGRSKPRSRHSGGSDSYSRHSPISDASKKALFFGTGTLAGLYIGSRMRPHVQIRSYHDLDNYEVCEGIPSELINSTGITRTYSHFLCPDNPNQLFEKYCCWDPTTGMGACCSYDVKMYSTSGRGAVVGSLLGIMLLIITLGSIAYCCFRCKRQKEGAPVDIPNAQFTSPLDSVYKPDQYPRMDPSSSMPFAYPPYSYPSNGQYVSYPQNGDVPYSSVQPSMPADRTGEIGSGWGASNSFPNPTTRPDFPPPPYPGSLTSNVETVNPSAPSSAWMTKS
ncbi:hypothetical protein EWB00_003113 [Schistosoma japonicum]|uniref:Uncharacterized protein n=1 Tax=Schistosoma japonicum TaxID=6182 RepID=A0A4Z2D9P1_SCHJA|nr:hypothetical protein EWB00_003113 [Schistosoma japonicum]